jgi:hypothetical protein
LCNTVVECGGLPPEDVNQCIEGCSQDRNAERVIRCGEMHLANGACNDQAMAMCVDGNRGGDGQRP